MARALTGHQSVPEQIEWGSTSQQSKGMALSSKSLNVSRIVHPATCETLGIHHEVVRKLRSVGLHVLLDGNGNFRQYDVLVKEFLSSFSVRNSDESNPDVWIFRLAGRDCQVTRDQINEIFRFPTQGYMAPPTMEEYMPFYKDIVGDYIYSPRDFKASGIRPPLWRYLHRVVATSINGRRETGVLSLDDMNVLYALHIERPLDWFTILSSRFHHWSTGSFRGLSGGLFISLLAQNYDLDLSGHAHVADIYVDMLFLRTCKMIRRSGNSYQMHYVEPGSRRRRRQGDSEDDQDHIPDPAPHSIQSIQEEQPTPPQQAPYGAAAWKQQFTSLEQRFTSMETMMRDIQARQDVQHQMLSSQHRMLSELLQMGRLKAQRCGASTSQQPQGQPDASQ